MKIISVSNIKGGVGKTTNTKKPAILCSRPLFVYCGFLDCPERFK